MSWNPLPGAGIDSIVKYLSFAPQQQLSSMATSLHWSHSTTWSFQLFLYSWFKVLFSSCLSPFYFLCYLYTTQNTWFTFENYSEATDKLKPITLIDINVISSHAVEFITSLQTSTIIAVANVVESSSGCRNKQHCLQPISVSCIHPDFSTWFDSYDSTIMIRHMSRDAAARLARGFKMEESESSVVSETESETGRPGERQGQLYTKTKKGKAVGIPTTVFLPKEETFTAWKSSIRSAIAELECISLGDVIVEKIYFITKSSKTLSLMGLQLISVLCIHPDF